MASGVAPSRAPDTRRLEHRIRSRRVDAPLDSTCPVGLQAVIGKLLAASPAERYDTARAIRHDLEHVAAGRAANGGTDAVAVPGASHEASPPNAPAPAAGGLDT